MIISAQILRADMTSAARKLEAEFNVEERTIRLEERVTSMQTDVAEIKADYRRLDTKVDATRDDVASVRDSVSALRVEMKDGFASVDRRMSEFATKADLAATKTELSNRIDVTKGELSDKIDATKESLMEHTDIAYDRKFIRFTGIMIGGVGALSAVIAYLEDMSFTKSQIALVTVCAAIVIWCVSLFGTRGQRK